MEVVSSRLSLSATATPVGSQRALERSNTFAAQRKWNASSSVVQQQRTSHRRRESLAGGIALLSLKAYYRKLRTFKGTIKALISFRRLPTFTPRSVSLTSAASPLATHSEAIATTDDPKVVGKLTDDDKALQTVQDQVKALVENGHVVTELDGASKEDVAYRMQGNLEHYTEENLRKRLRLQEHPHMVALTQRLWLSATHDNEEHLSFGEYEAYMLRLHRLILPEFDLAQSKALVKDDWARDTDGSDHLDYRFFHFSMFELVDLWTDTVEAEDYVSLLYCIMHSLTFEWDGRYLLKDLDDINPVDIVEAAKEITMDEIERDLAREVNSSEAQMYRDRIACEENDPELDGDATAASEPGDATAGTGDTAPISETETSGAADTSAATTPEIRKAPSPSAHKAAAGRTNTPSSDKRKSVVRTPSSPSRAAGDRAHLRDAHSRAGGGGRNQHSPNNSSAAGHSSLQPTRGEGDPSTLGQHSGSNATAGTNGLLGSDIQSSADTFHGVDGSSRLSLQGQLQVGSGPRGSTSHAGSRVIYSASGGNGHFATGTDASDSPISIMSLGSGGEYLNMVGKPNYLRKPSGALASRPSFIQLSGASAGGDHEILGHGLQGPHSREGGGGLEYAYPHVQAADSMEMPMVHGEGRGGTPTARSTFVTPRLPQSPRGNLKDDETRPGTLSLYGEQPHHSLSSGGGLQGNLSPRARSAKAHARLSKSAMEPPGVTGHSNNGDAIVPLFALGLDLSSLKHNARDQQQPPPLMVGGLQSARMSILSRPATSSPSSRRHASTNLAMGANPASGFDGLIQVKAIHETTSPRHGRPQTRASHLYQQRASHSQVDNLAISTFSVHALAAATHAPLPRQTMIQFSSLSPRNFAGSVVGSKPVTFESSPSSTPPRASMGKVDHLQGSPRRSDAVEPSLGPPLGLSGAHAPVGLHKKPATPRKPVR